jgi:hypothetical protein
LFAAGNPRLSTDRLANPLVFSIDERCTSPQEKIAHAPPTVISSRASLFGMFHELSNAVLGSLAALQPLDLPFGNSFGLFGDEMAAFRFVDPFELLAREVVLHQPLEGMHLIRKPCGRLGRHESRMECPGYMK